MIKRFLDLLVATLALTVTSPLLLIAAVGIKLSSPGPIFYRAKRIGLDLRRSHFDSRGRALAIERRRQGGYRGREFTMYKFRTMRVHGSEVGNPITALNDSRVFPFGAFLRVTKIDELPQFINVLRGEMTLVGPRPEAPEIVRSHYTPDDLTTLQVTPGLTSPGTVYYYAHCKSMLATDRVVDEYVERLLPAKLALDRAYIKRSTVLYDIRVTLLTIVTIVTIVTRALGKRWFPDPPELAEADVKTGSCSTDR
jgi:lipopolysaccharide/colanic/teichoic acid biosynthesis glycosyltransferase